MKENIQFDMVCIIIFWNSKYYIGYATIDTSSALREESSQTNVILQYKLLASIVRAVRSVNQQSKYVQHFCYTLYDGKYDCKITTYQTIFQLQCFVLLNNHQYNCNITKPFLRVDVEKIISYFLKMPVLLSLLGTIILINL